MTDSEKREAARQFFQKWVHKGKEDEDDRSYWIDILTRIMGVEDVTDHIEFQKKVIVDGNTKRIDAYIPEIKVVTVHFVPSNDASRCTEHAFHACSRHKTRDSGAKLHLSTSRDSYV